jgi:hypothetical protein
VAAAKERIEEPADEDGEDLHPDEAEVLGKGRSIEDRANDGEAEEADDEEDGQFTIPGTGTGLTLNAGGKKPSSSEAKMDGLSLAIKGEFKKGDTVRLVVDAVVRDIHFPDDYKGADVVRTRRIHIFRPLTVEPMQTPE